MKFLTRRASRPDAGGWTALPSIRSRRARLARLLAVRTSLTAALQRHGQTEVTVLTQRLAIPDADEYRLMQVRPKRRMLVREVVLRVNGEPWVFAHTVANPAAARLLRRAGRRPLATVLFADPKVHPQTLHYRNIDRRHPLFAAASGWCDDESLGYSARRAVFIRGWARLLVTEVFLSAVG